MRRHLLTGALQCGKPGCGHYLSGHWTNQGTLTYQCRQCRGVSVRAQHVEPLVYKLVGGRLAMPDAVDLLKAEIHDEAEAEAIRLELASLYAERVKIGVERGKRLLTGEQALVATDLINEDIAKLERKQQDQEKLRVFEGLDLGTPKVIGQIKKLSPDRFRAVLSVVVVLTVDPVGKGGNVFDPERVGVDWR
jgi:hypothetical protein